MNPVGQNERFAALDVFRGATVAAMILVNNAGDWNTTFAPLLHADWDGWTPTDLVFPFFLVAVGLAIPYALGRRLEQPSTSRADLHRQILRRTLILFALGLLLNWWAFWTVDWSRARIPGVLQRIAVVYGIAALAYLHLGRRARLALAFALLLGYGLAMTLVPVPGHGAGDLSAAGNLAAWVDHQVFGPHVWRYAPGPGDPEGLLSTLPAIATALFGVAAAEWLRRDTALAERLVGLFAAGNLAIACGLVLDAWMPINKNLWSVSYSVFTAGFALVVLALIATTTDLGHHQRWTPPFLAFGTNAIVAFVGSSLLARALGLIKVNSADPPQSLKGWLYTPLEAALPPYWASLAWALATVLLWWGIVDQLRRRGIRFSV